MDDLIFEVKADSFAADVVERSQQLPVVLVFFADQVPPSVEVKNLLSTLVPRYTGKVALGLIDVGVDQTLAQHLRVQGLPSIRIVQGGQIADQLDGPQDEAALTALLEKLTLSSGDVMRAQLEDVIAAGDYQTAINMLQQSITDEPNNMVFRCELADALVLHGDLEEAAQVLASIPKETAERTRPDTRLGFAKEAQELPAETEIQQSATADPADLETKYQLAVVHAAGGNMPQALDAAMEILQADREFREDIGRVTMLRIFDVLGKGNELASAYRRRMFNFMH